MNERVCKICGVDISGLNRSAQYCSDACKKERDRQRNRKNAIKRNQNLPENAPTCPMCGLRSNALDTHLVRTHHMTVDEFMTKYPGLPVYSEEYAKDKVERVSGDKNPGYRHAGKLSPFCKDFVKYEGLTEEEIKKEIDQVKENLHQSRSK
jgi:hypothetical protein